MRREIKYYIWPNDIKFGEKVSNVMEFLKKRNFEIKHNAQDPPNSYMIQRDKYITDSGGFIQFFI